MESEALKATILPRWGSKLASLIYKPLGGELLWQNPAKAYRASSYADPYELGEASGFDEMFPTISRCFYEREPWAGVEMPDHGEVWSLPWAYQLEGEHLLLWVEGVRFPYRIEKTIGMAWPPEEVPYLGVWVNEGGWFDQYNIAPEPATAAMDRVDFSKAWGMSSVLNRGEARQWWLTLTVRQGEQPRGGPL